MNHHICVLYTTATCNLKCNYCYIDKSPVLVALDEQLEKSYKDDYYFNFMKRVFQQEDLEKMEFWGGEPSYGLKRAIPTIHKAIDYFPKLKNFMFSTNATTDTWLKDIIEFCLLFTKHPEKQFYLDIQLSLDGPEYINDFNRGKDSTKKLFNNLTNFFKILDDLLDKVPNLRIFGHFKPTLDSKSIQLLQSKEKILEYYQYFETYLDLSTEYVHNKRWQLALCVPNTATPSPYTKEDGLNFANLCKLSYEIMEDGKKEKNLKYFGTIIPHAVQLKPYCPNVSFYDGAKACGTGCVILGLLPNNLISICHNGFVELLGEYKEQSIKNAKINLDRTIDFEMFIGTSKKQLVYTEENYNKHKEKMRCYYEDQTSFSLIELTSLITTYAKNDLIDKKYINPEEALKAAHFIFSMTASCMRDNLGVTGTLYLTQTGIIKLLLNGAKDYIELVI